MKTPSGAFARRILTVASFLVPSVDRRRWHEEWSAELFYLDQARGDDEAAGLPSPVRMALGALPHSLWERKEWTVAVLLQDVRFAIRVLRRNPTFTALAVLTLALGIGANTTIFSMTNATLLRAPNAIDAPDRVVQIGRDRADEGFDNLAYPYYTLFRDNVSTLDGIAAWSSQAAFLGHDGDLTSVNSQLVTGEYFDVLGLHPALGRMFAAADDRDPGAHPVVVVGYAAWERLFGSDPDLIGTELRLNNRPYTVVGVAADGFGGTDVIGSATDVWVPMAMARELLGERWDFARVDDPGRSWLWFIGRLGDDSTSQAAQAELDTLYQAQYEANWGEAAGAPIGVLAGVGLRPDEREQIGAILVILSVVVGVVLAVACGNLANLLLARGVARSRELAVRAALGAGRVRIVRQLLTESLLLALGGGLCAIVLTLWTARMLPLLLPVNMAVGFQPDLRVFGFATAVSVVAGILFGVVPALRASRPDIVDTLKDGSAGAGSRGGWLRNGLVVGQLALSFALLAVTALLVRSMWAAQSAEPGYATRTVSTLTFSTGLSGLDENESRQLYDRLAREMRALPGAESAALASNLPFAGWSRRSVVWPEPRPDAERPFTQLDWTVVTPEFHSTIELPLLAGEAFTAMNSGPEMGPVMILSESAARLLFGDESPIGRLVPTSEERLPEESLRVLGVVADARMRSLQRTPSPSAYVPASQNFTTFMTVYVRAESESIDLGPAMRQVLATAAPEIGVLVQGSLHERMGRSLRDTVTVARLAGIFGGLAALLAAMGLYGVISFMASSRMREVGVRMALGARPKAVLGLFVRQAAVLAGVGVAVGVALTIALQGMIGSLLYGITAGEPMTLLTIGVGVVLLAVLAALAPAHRATRVTPVSALRQE